MEELFKKNIKKSQYYTEIRKRLVPKGYKPFDIFATYQYLYGQTKGNWENSVRLAAYVARRK
jgi:hypothetical protein